MSWQYMSWQYMTWQYVTPTMNFLTGQRPRPVASTLAELEAMAAARDRNSVVCMPAHNYVYEDFFERTSALIADGSLGDITSCYVLYNVHHPEEIMSRDSVQGVIRQILTHHA